MNMRLDDNMTAEYKENFIKGLEYQDFVMLKLMENLGISLSGFSSKKYQYSIGENIQGIEIKFDDRYKETGNLYIEISEKSNAKNKSYIDSGIYRNDNSWLYAIGDYNNLFIFGKEILKMMHKSGKYKEVRTPTSKGILIGKDGQRTCLKKLEFE